MSVKIVKVTTKKQLKSFIRFKCELYKGNPYFVPDLYEDMLVTLDKEKNAAFVLSTMIKNLTEEN